MSGPIKPSEVVARKIQALPPEVFAAFNECIALEWDGRAATVVQKDVAARIAKAMDISVTEVFERGYLDVEEVYRAEGWIVEYDKPGYNETYDATFCFTVGRKANGT